MQQSQPVMQTQCKVFTEEKEKKKKKKVSLHKTPDVNFCDSAARQDAPKKKKKEAHRASLHVYIKDNKTAYLLLELIPQIYDHINP